MNLATLFAVLGASCVSIASLTVTGAPIPPYVVLGLSAASIVFLGLAAAFRSPIEHPPG